MLFRSRAPSVLRPVNEAILAEVCATGSIQVDESPVPVLDAAKPGGNATGWWWTYRTPHRSVSRHFDETRAHSVAVKRLADYRGKLHLDGYQVHDKFSRPGLLHLGCWSHTRRPFHELVSCSAKRPPKAPSVVMLLASSKPSANSTTAIR